MSEKAMVLAGGADLSIVELAVIGGDLAKLSPPERTSYYARVCDSLGLNPYTRPFEYIVLNGKLTLYARRDAAEQLRKIHRVSVRILGRETTEDGVYIVTAQARTPDGREDESTGAVCLGGLRGEALANAYMKAETKAKRRVTLSICGLGWTDESEVDSIPGAVPTHDAAALTSALDDACGAGKAAVEAKDRAAWVKVRDDLAATLRALNVPKDVGEKAMEHFKVRTLPPRQPEPLSDSTGGAS